VAILAICSARASLAQPSGAPPGAAGTPSSPAPPNDERTEQARRHFKNGIKLFQDRDFAGALAEFEASYKLKPGPASLQNIALSLKELRRYAEAANALDALLKRHSAELRDDETRAVKDALGELADLIASLVIVVTPAGANVTVDGRGISAAERAQGVRVGVGEHTISAEAPGYQRSEQIVRLASRERRRVELKLRLVSGLLSVETNDPEAAIAVNGKPLAFEHWRGTVPPGEHYVQVYKSTGFKPFEKRFEIAAGQSVEIEAPELAEAEEPEEADVPASAKPSMLLKQRGWYLLGTVGAMSPLTAPTYFDQQNADVSGGMIGVRGGYRLYTPIAVELMIEAGRNDVRNVVCKRPGDVATPECDGETEFDYDLGSVRLGPNLRLMSTADSLRFIGALGAGAVFHQLKTSGLPDGEREFKGADAYFLMEAGAQINFGHLLLEGTLSYYIEGTSNLGDNLGNAYEPAVLHMVAVGLRGGWSQWTPTKK